MAKLCLVTACMGRLGFLRRSLGAIAGQAGCSCVVVDYSCPDGAGDWAEANVPGVRVVRVAGRTEYNRSEAKNAGASAAGDASWLGFVDADVVLAPGFADAVLPALEPGRYYRAATDEPGERGTFVCLRDDFARAGGFDELYRGWGEEDHDLYDALEFAGVKPTALPAGILRHIDHDEDDRVRFHETRQRHLSQAVNWLYRHVKWDQARLNGRVPGPDDRAATYDLIDREVRRAWQSGGRADVTVKFPPWGIVRESLFSRSITYTFEKLGGPD